MKKEACWEPWVRKKWPSWQNMEQFVIINQNRKNTKQFNFNTLQKILNRKCVPCFQYAKPMFISQQSQDMDKASLIKKKKWAGWEDVPLSSKGVNQAKQCAQLLKHAGFEFDQIYTSVLSRAICTSNFILDELKAHYIPVNKHWRLNEKNYGSLEGKNKLEINDKYGDDLVATWRRSFDIPPPKLQQTDQRHPFFDPRYKHINPQFLPNSQSLADVIQRLRPLWDFEIKAKIKKQRNLLIVGHGTSVRGLVYLIGQKDKETIRQFNIPNATPIIFTLDEDLNPLHLEYLGDQKQIKKMMEQIKNQTKRVQAQ